MLFLGVFPLFSATVGVAAPPHPRIWLTPDGVVRLRAMAQDTERNELGYVPAEACRDLLARADEFAAAPAYHYAVDMPGVEGGPTQRWEYTLSPTLPPRHDEYGHYPPWTAMFQERSDSITTRLQHFVLAYAMTGKVLYLDKAREIVDAMCAWPAPWTDPSYGGGRPCLDTGHAAEWVGIFYDWCYDALTPEERQRVREALVEKALVPIDGVMDGVDPYHNYTAVIAMGLCVGSIAVLGEDERAEGWIEHALRRVQLNFDAQGRDGGPLEGPMYGTYAADCFSDLIWALNTAGVPNALMDHPYLRTLPRYCISLLNPNNRQQPCFGDGGPGAGFGSLLLTLALAGDTDAAWYCREIGLLNPDSVRRLIALDPARIRPEQPRFNPSACFVDVGYAVLRNGYEPGGAFVALKCGPPEAVVGHNHYDHNSFVLNYAGTWIASDPGYRDYFEPRLRKYTTSTLGHSSIVLDLDQAYLDDTTPALVGHDQVQLNRGRLEEFCTSDHFDYVLGAAAEAYNTDEQRVLDRFDRQMVLSKPNVVFIRDTLQAPQEHRYSFLLHPDATAEVRLAPPEAQLLGPQCLLQTCISSPARITLTTASYPGAESRGPYLAATTGPVAATTITSVLVPRRDSALIGNPGFEAGTQGWQIRDMPGFTENHVIDTEVKHGGQASARIDGGGYYYSRHFVVSPGVRLTARWWAKCTAAQGASSVLYFWRDGTAFAQEAGPAAGVDEWRPYEFSAVVPEGTQEVCLALQFFGEGQCWYDDVEVTADEKVPESEPAVLTPLDDGAGGCVAEVDGVTHVLLCGEAGHERTVQAAAHEFTTDAELAVVQVAPQRVEGFLVRGTLLNMDGRPVPLTTGEWLHQRQ